MTAADLARLREIARLLYAAFTELVQLIEGLEDAEADAPDPERAAVRDVRKRAE